MSDETEKTQMTLAEFQENCKVLVEGLAALLDEFNDESDPVGVTRAVVARYLEYYGIGK